MTNGLRTVYRLLTKLNREHPGILFFVLEKQCQDLHLAISPLKLSVNFLQAATIALRRKPGCESGSVPGKSHISIAQSTILSSRLEKLCNAIRVDVYSSARKQNSEFILD